MEKLLIEKKKGELVIAGVVTGLTAIIFFKTVSASLVLALISLPLMAIFNVIANQFFTSVLISRHYGSDVKSYNQELEEAHDYFDALSEMLGTKRLVETAVETPESLISEKSEKIIAYFQDAPIYEWVSIKHGDEEYRYTYHSCVTPRQRDLFDLAPDQILIEPGIIYQVEHGVNNNT